MSDEPRQTLSDDELAIHLRRRGAGALPEELAASINARVEATPRIPRWRFVGNNIPAAAAVLAAILVVAIVGPTLLLAGRTANGPGASPTTDVASSATPQSSASAAPSSGSSPSSPPAPSSAAPTTIVFPLDEAVTRIANGSMASGSIVVIDVPADAVTPRFPEGVAHSCPQLCPTWILTAGSRRLTVSVSMRAVRGYSPPTTVVGRQAFIVDSTTELRLLGPATTAPEGAPRETTEVSGSMAGFLVVHGWLRTSPVTHCTFTLPISPPPVDIDGSPLDIGKGQCQGTWLLPTAANPFAAVGPSSQLRLPPGSLRVQLGARGLSTVDSPREGVFLLRLAGDACPPGMFCALTENPTGFWNLLGEVAAP
jgi:hypothetical protein